MTPTDQFQLFAAILAFAMAWVVGGMARRKGYAYANWFLAGLLFWPVALLLIATKEQNPKTLRTCPDCKGRVPFDAPVCRHCGRDERRTSDAPQT